MLRVFKFSKISKKSQKLVAIIAILLVLAATFFVVRNISADTNDTSSLLKAYITLLQKQNAELETKKSAVPVILHNGADYGDIQSQIDSNQRIIDWLGQDLPAVMNKPVSETLAELAIVGMPKATEIPVNGDPVKITRVNGEVILVHPAVLENQIQNNRRIGKVIETNNYARDYVGNDGVGGSLYIQTADGKSQTVLDPYFDMLNDRKGTPESIKSVDDIIADYKKQQVDFEKVNLDIITLSNASTDTLEVDRLRTLYQNNDRNIQDIISRGKKWVVIREALKSPEKNRIDPDALSQFLVADPGVTGKEQILSENAGIYNYIPAQKITKERLDLASQEFNNQVLLTAPKSPLTNPVANKTAGELAKATAMDEKIKIDGALIRVLAIEIVGSGDTSLGLAFDHYQKGLSNLLGSMPGFDTAYGSKNPLVRQAVAEAAIKSSESVGKIDPASLPAPDPSLVTALRAATGKIVASFGAEPATIAGDSIRLTGWRAKVISDDLTGGIGGAMTLRPALASASTTRTIIATSAVQQQLRYSSTSSLSINPTTARPEFTTQIIDTNGIVIGSVGFDPIAQRYNGHLTQTFGDKKVTLYSDARTGYVYAALANQTGPLLHAGKLELTSVTVSKSGDIGGEFKLANRVFRYNPNSKAFEIPIASIIGQDKITSLKGKGILGQALGNLSIDTNGTVVGSLNLTGEKSTNTGSLFFDSTGNIGATYTFNQKDLVGDKTQLTAIASFGVSKDGVSGSVNVGKLAFDKNLFVSFDKGGITGVSIPIGSFGVGVGKDGSISLSSVIPIGGLPIPISLSQDAHGNFGLGVPFVGTLITFGHEDRDLSAPQLQFTQDTSASATQASASTATTSATSASATTATQSSSSVRMECVFYRHSIKKMFKTVRPWNTQTASGKTCPLQLSAEEQKMRANVIFDKYRTILKRNPTQAEFVEWYFYGGGTVFNLMYTNTFLSSSTYRTMQTKAYLDSTLKSANYATTCGNGDKNRCSDPANAMPYNPFNDKEVATYQAKLNALPASQTTEAGTVSMQNFFDAITTAAANDPYFDNGNYNIPGLGTALEATQTTIVTASGTETTTVAPQAVSSAVAIIGEGTATAGSTDGSRTYTDPNETDAGALIENEENQEQELVQGNVKVFSSGFSVYSVDSTDQAINAQPFIDAGLGIFEFNTDGSAKWKSNLLKDDIQVLKAGIGYYIYNPKGDDVTVEITSAYSGQVKGLNKGWNLLSNSSDQSVKLDAMVYDVIKPDATCQTSDCYETKTLRQVVDGGRTKGKLMKAIAGETDPAKAFEAVDLTQNLDSVEIPAKSLFWIYLAK